MEYLVCEFCEKWQSRCECEPASKRLLRESESLIHHSGRWVNRIEPDAGNPREAVFAKIWAEENNTKDRGYFNEPVLLTLLHLRYAKPDENPDIFGGMSQKGELTQEEATAAATVIQWLGTNVGWCFLERCINACGYDLKRKPKK